MKRACACGGVVLTGTRCARYLDVGDIVICDTLVMLGVVVQMRISLQKASMKRQEDVMFSKTG